MKLYNTLTRSKDLLDPGSKTLSLYTCGPTVYDFAHIGNLRSFIFEDSLRRSLELNGFDVKHVMNITDVGHLVSDADEGEDKLQKGAEREGKSVEQVAEFYTDAFKNDVERLNILPPNAYHDKKRGDTFARATDFIAEQQDMVKALLDKGYAYQTEQAIYFEVAKLTGYGRLSGQKLEDKEVAVRDEVVTDPDKRSPHDFAVWFFTVGRYADHSMHWPSPWGDGFPGWHLECSAIIHTTLGDPIDIHTGGVDHIGTHHTNEMAQTEAAFGHDLAKVWMHGEFMLVDGFKMSKSKSNYFTLTDITSKGYSPLTFRLLMLQAHYRSELNFTWQSLRAAQNFLIRLYGFADRQFQIVPSDQPGTDFLKGEEIFKTFEHDFKAALADDLGTPEALAKISALIDSLDKAAFDPTFIPHFERLLQFIDDGLALGLSNRHDISDDLKELIAKREHARVGGDFNTADTFRNQLSKKGIGVKDTPYGPRWHRTQV